jgi:hypothetical protein
MEPEVPGRPESNPTKRSRVNTMYLSWAAAVGAAGCGKCVSAG